MILACKLQERSNHSPMDCHAKEKYIIYTHTHIYIYIYIYIYILFYKLPKIDGKLNFVLKIFYHEMDENVCQGEKQRYYEGNPARYGG